MKRKLAWLALPLVLCTLIFCVKWRAEHPTPTKEDLKFRALIVGIPLVQISPYSSHGAFNVYEQRLSVTESIPFADNFYFSPAPFKIGLMETLFVEFVLSNPQIGGVVVRLGVTRGNGSVASIGVMGEQKERNLHPATVKRWMELLLANPRIGPELRARMK